MVRKPTVILLVIFALLIGLMFYLQKNPLPSQTSLTPSPTPRAQIVPGLMPGDILMVSLKTRASADEILVKKTGEKWLLGKDGKELQETAKIEQVRSEIAALKVITEMPEDMVGSALGLDQPAYVLAIQVAGSQTHQIEIGEKTPIENGYYAQMDGSAAFVVSNTAIDTIVSLMQEINTPTGTPTP